MAGKRKSSRRGGGLPDDMRHVYLLRPDLPDDVFIFQILSRLDCISLQSLTQACKRLLGCYLPHALSIVRQRLQIGSYRLALEASNFGKLCRVLDTARESQLPEIIWSRWLTDVDARVIRAALHSLRGAAHPKWVPPPLPLAVAPLQQRS